MLRSLFRVFVVRPTVLGELLRIGFDATRLKGVSQCVPPMDGGTRTDIENAVDNGIHAGVSAGKDEESFTHQRANFVHRAPIDPVPQTNDVVRCPAHGEHDDNGDGHLQGAFFGPT